MKTICTICNATGVFIGFKNLLETNSKFKMAASTGLIEVRIFIFELLLLSHFISDFARVCVRLHGLFFVAMFLGCTSTGRVGLWFLWFYVQEHPKAQPAVVHF